MTGAVHLDLGLRLGRALLDVATMEGAAAAIAHKLGSSPLLTAEERDFAVDRIQRDEARHMNWLLSASMMLGQSQARDVGRDLKDRVRVLERLAPSPDRSAIDRCVLARMNHDERYLLRMFEGFRFVLAQFLPAEVVHSFREIENDEIVHAKWGRKVLHRLEVVHPEWRVDIRRCQTLKNSATQDALAQLDHIFRLLGGTTAWDARHSIR